MPTGHLSALPGHERGGLRARRSLQATCSGSCGSAGTRRHASCPASCCFPPLLPPCSPTTQAGSGGVGGRGFRGAPEAALQAGAREAETDPSSGLWTVWGVDRGRSGPAVLPAPAHTPGSQAWRGRRGVRGLPSPLWISRVDPNQNRNLLLCLLGRQQGSPTQTWGRQTETAC